MLPSGIVENPFQEESFDSCGGENALSIFSAEDVSKSVRSTFFDSVFEIEVTLTSRTLSRTLFSRTLSLSIFLRAVIFEMSKSSNTFD